MKKIGLISDTHGYIDPRLFDLFASCDEVWHAGDIGSAEVLEKLQSFKPLRAVYGNVDGAEIRYQLNEVERFELDGVDVVMMHIGGRPGKYSPMALAVLAQKTPKVLVCGHSHILRVIFDKKYGCLHINPGACGRFGFHQVRTALRFVIDNGEIRDMEIIELGNRK